MALSLMSRKSFNWNMKRILYIQSNFGLGGINRITAVKENYLVKHCYEIHNLNAQDRKGLPPEGMYDERIKMHYISGDKMNQLAGIPIVGHLLRFFYCRYMMLRVILGVNPDIIVVNMPFLEPASVVWLTFWKKRILEFHGWYNHPSITSLPLRERVYYTLTSPFYQMIALTQGEADKLEILTGHKSLYIPNSQYSFPSNISTCESKRVISMARFTSQKNLPGFLPLWRRVQERHPDWELHLYGEGPDEPKMREIVDDLHLTTVHIHPYTRNVEEEMLNSSIYVFPSIFEGFGLVLLESMSVGVPCVSYDCPFGPSEIIRDGEDGFLTEYNNPDAMIDKVLLLIGDESLRKEMGRKARENSLKSFNIDEIMGRWMKLFEEL